MTARKIVAGLFVSLDGVVEMEEESTLIADGVVPELIKRRLEPGKDISIAGSPTLVRSLLREGLVDELRLLLFPIVIGNGKLSLTTGPGRCPCVW
jgi:dihydrofolate reductase